MPTIFTEKVSSSISLRRHPPFAPQDLPPPVSLAGEIAAHFSQETPTLYPQDLQAPVSLAGEIATHFSLETPSLYVQDLPPSLFFPSWHLNIVIRCFGACFLPWAHQLPLSLISNPFLSWDHHLPLSLISYQFLSWDHHLPLSWSSAATRFFHEIIICPFSVGTFTYEIISCPVVLRSLRHYLRAQSQGHHTTLDFTSLRSSTTIFFSWDHQLSLSLMRSSTALSPYEIISYPFYLDHQLPLLFMRSSAISFTHEIINYPFSLMRSSATPFT